MSALPAPTGMRVEADSSLQLEDEGRMAIGGSPLRIMRLTGEGADRLRRWLDGAPVGERPADRQLMRRLLAAGLVHPVEWTEPAVRTITVVVPVLDDVDGLERVVSSLAADHPTVVVDDGSADRAGHVRVAEATGATYVRNDVPAGPAAARNRGLDHVETDVVAFVDVDVVLAAATLAVLAEHLEDPDVVAVAPRVMSSTTETGRLARYEVVRSPLDLGPEPSLVGPGRRVPYVPAACLVARSDAVREVGGFDPSLRWGEDVDLVWRLVEAGHAIRYDPAVEVFHRPRTDLAGWIDQRRSYGRSAAPLAARHGTAVAPARCSPWSLAAWGATVAGHPIVGLGIAAGSTAALAAKLDHLPGGPQLAARLGSRGHLHAALGLTRTAWRAWWPITLAAALARPRLRRRLLAALVALPLVDWARGDRSIDPATAVGLGIADDLAYGLGVWEGMWAERSPTAIRPDLVGWPDRRDVACGHRPEE